MRTPSIATASLRMLLPQAWTAFIPTASNPYELSWVGLTNSMQTTEQTVTVKGKEAKLTTLAIFGTPYAPLRQMAQLGKRFSAEYKKDAGTLNLTVGKTLTTMGNEMLMDYSGHLVTKKADFKLLIGGKESGIQCFYVDGEVYAPWSRFSRWCSKI